MSPSLLAVIDRATRGVSLAGGVRRFALAVVAAALLVVVALPGVALGAQTRPAVSSFDGADSDAGPFSFVRRIAVHQGSGTVYAIDAGAGVVDKFDAAGVAQDFSALGSSSMDGNAVPAPDGPANFLLGADSDLAVDNSGTASDGNLVVLSEGAQTAWVFDSAGNYLHRMTGFGDPCGTAIDSGGNVWVADFATKLISQYTAAGVATGFTADTSAQGGACHIAFDSNDDLYAARYQGAVSKYSAAIFYLLSTEIDSASTQSVTTNRGNDEAYFVHTDSDKVSAYDAAGAHLYDFAKGLPHPNFFRGPVGVAVNEASDQAYASNAGDNRVYVFGPPVTVAAATTSPASAVGVSSATLNGSVDPGGVAVSDCHFEYGTDTSYGQTAPCVPDAGSIPADLTEHPVSADITGLESARTYHVRLVVVNADGTVRGDDQTFTTIAAATTNPASDVGLSGATLNGSVNPDGIAVADCHFEYGTDTSYGQSVPCVPDAASIPADLVEHPVSAAVTGLEPGHSYHFRLATANANGSTHGDDQTFTTTGPGISGEINKAVGPDSATVKAQINPNGQNTTYHVEYGTDTAYGQSTSESTSIGSDPFDHPVTTTLSGLTAGTTYHWRYVATNADGTANGSDRSFVTQTVANPTSQACPNAQYRTGHAATLPDCRAYEQATPIDKNGNNPVGGLDRVRAADDGEAVNYMVRGGAPGGDGAQDYPSFMARRGSGAWSSAGNFPPATYGDVADVLGFTPDLHTIYSRAGFFADKTTAFLARDSVDRSIESVVPPNGLADSFRYVDSSTDGSTVYFEALGPLTPDAAPGFARNLYAWDRASGAVTLAGVLPDGSTPPAGSFAGVYQISTNNVSQSAQGYLQDNNTVSDNGAAVFFTAVGTGQLYARKDATGPGASTVRVAASQKTNGSGPGGSDPNGPKPAAFRVATPDGSKVLFTSSEELTNDANTGTANQGTDLYAYDLASDQLTDLTPDSGDANGADVQGVIGISDDASYAYFAANGVLADGATPGDCDVDVFFTAQLCNLYLWHDGEFTFITRVSAEGGTGQGSDITNWLVDSGANGSTGRVTPDGRTLLFRSNRQLTGYDNSSGCGFDGTSPCAEFYRYRVGDPGVTCVSCNPSGEAPRGAALLRSTSSGVTSGSPAPFRTRNLSVSGDRVFFETSDALVAADTNGNGANGDVQCVQSDNTHPAPPSCQDVYMWQADGSGSCHSSADNGGCLYLLSTGRRPYASSFLDASASGDDAFIFTDSQLVPGDQDGNVDVYDVRVGGGLAAQHPVAQAPCSGEACKAPLTAPVVPMTVGSVSFSGDGNETAPARTVVSVSRLKAVTGSVARLRVRVPRAGRISVSGASLRTARRSVPKGATYTIRVRLSAKAKRALEHSSKLKVRVRVAFVPRTGSSAHKLLTLSFKQPKHAKKAALPGSAGSKGGH